MYLDLIQNKALFYIMADIYIYLYLVNIIFKITDLHTNNLL